MLLLLLLLHLPIALLCFVNRILSNIWVLPSEHQPDNSRVVRGLLSTLERAIHAKTDSNEHEFPSSIEIDFVLRLRRHNWTRTSSRRGLQSTSQTETSGLKILQGRAVVHNLVAKRKKTIHNVHVLNPATPVMYP